MKILNHHITKNLFIALVFISVALAGVVFLAQSLKFLELVMDAGASSYVFWLMTMLALPRFMETIIPVALMISVLFTYNRMFIDNELVSLKAAGMSPLEIARPAINLSIIVALWLLLITVWMTPTALSKLQDMRHVIKAKYSLLLFKEGTFNTVGDDITIYVSNKNADGSLSGIMIHDLNKKGGKPYTIIAQQGILTEGGNGNPQMVVYQGSRQEFDSTRSSLNRLNFERYTVELPEDNSQVSTRWRHPDERSFSELLFPDMDNKRDMKARNEFFVEINKRLLTPLLAPAFVLICAAVMLTGQVGRKGLAVRIAISCFLVFVLQGGFIAFYNIARQEVWGIPVMYATVFVPIIAGYFVLRFASVNTDNVGIFGGSKKPDIKTVKPSKDGGKA